MDNGLQNRYKTANQVGASVGDSGFATIKGNRLIFQENILTLQVHLKGEIIFYEMYKVWDGNTGRFCVL